MKGAAWAMFAALLFGVSTPLAKLLLPHVSPMLMAGLLYLGSGVGLALYSLVRARRRSPGQKEAALTRQDAPWLAGAIAAGGVVAPMLLMWGLAMTPASSASLLLNLEGVLTALLAWFVFKENLTGASRWAWRLFPLAECAYRGWADRKRACRGVLYRLSARVLHGPLTTTSRVKFRQGTRCRSPCSRDWSLEL